MISNQRPAKDQNVLLKIGSKFSIKTPMCR